MEILCILLRWPATLAVLLLVVAALIIWSVRNLVTTRRGQ